MCIRDSISMNFEAASLKAAGCNRLTITITPTNRHKISSTTKCIPVLSAIEQIID